MSVRRARRVRTLLFGIVVLSIADLVITVVHLRTVGMVEANPIAAWLIETTRSPWVLAAYKIATVGLCVALLDRVRRERLGEIGAWFGLAVLMALCLVWHSYSKQMSDPVEIAVVRADAGDGWHFLD